jgi:hypothetical protein
MTTLNINYSGSNIQTPELVGTLTLGDIKSQAVSRWPELTNATVLVNNEALPVTTQVSQLTSGSTVTFSLPTGTKN